jgi:hypothetical protein
MTLWIGFHYVPKHASLNMVEIEIGQSMPGSAHRQQGTSRIEIAAWEQQRKIHHAMLINVMVTAYASRVASVAELRQELAPFASQQFSGNPGYVDAGGSSALLS